MTLQLHIIRQKVVGVESSPDIDAHFPVSYWFEKVNLLTKTICHVVTGWKTFNSLFSRWWGKFSCRDNYLPLGYR